MAGMLARTAHYLAITINLIDSYEEKRQKKKRREKTHIELIPIIAKMMK